MNSEIINPQSNEKSGVLKSVDFINDQLSDEIEIADHTIQEIEKGLTQIEKDNPNEAKRLRKKFIKKLKKYTLAFSLASSITAGGLTANYERTRYEVQEKKGGTRVEYIHEDKETTDILEYLSGRKELDRSIRSKLAKASLLKWLADLNIDFPLNLQDLEEPLFIKTICNILRTQDPSRPTTSRLEEIASEIESKDFLNMFIPEKMDLGPDIYNILWEIENMAGNPRIRWGITDALYNKITSDTMHSDAYYNPLNNTMYIGIPNTSTSWTPVRQFLGESAHGIQATDPFKFLTGLIKNTAIFTENIYKTKDIISAYDKTYETPGTLEHEAHSVIAPKLEDKIKIAEKTWESRSPR